jgi:flagellar biosynthesis/type III secretory pathway protein FliH
MKLSPEAASPAEFRPYVVPAAPDKPVAAETQAAHGDRFHLPGQLLQVLWSDPSFSEQWEEVIEQRVRERYERDQTQLREQTVAAARAEGLKQGIEQGKALLDETCQRLETVVRRVLFEKESLLRSHERVWAEGMLHLLKRFLVPRPEELMSVISAWLDDCLRAFTQKGNVRILLCPSDYSALVQGLSFRVHPPTIYQFGSDESLAPGDIRCECDGGGAFFSPSQELSELHGYLEGIFQNEAAAASHTGEELEG